MSTDYKENQYIFVFQAHISRTNMQRAELLSLIEMQSDSVTFEFVDIEAFLRGNSGNRKEYLDCYYSPFKEKSHKNLLACVAFMEQLAIVWTNFELDLMKTICRAGYLHSAGDLIFISRWESLNHEWMLEVLRDYCVKRGCHFNLYFFNKTHNLQIQTQLEHLMIDDKRYFIGNKAFSAACDCLTIELDKALNREKIDRIIGENIFILKDVYESPQKGGLVDFYDDRYQIDYAIGYLSSYKKDNPIHSIDEMKEAKPFWAGIDTTPHKLMNAMLNLSKVDKDSVVVDPFCYTGTVAIEAAQMGCKVNSADISEVQGAIDNFEFLCKGAENFCRITEKLREIMKNQEQCKYYEDLASKSVCLNSYGLPDVGDDFKIDRIIDTFKNQPHDLRCTENRLYFYIVRRYFLERKRGFIRSDTPVDFVKNYIGSADLSKKREKSEIGYFVLGKQLTIFEENMRNGIGPLASPKDRGFEENFVDGVIKSNRVGYIPADVKDVKFFTKDIMLDFNSYGIADNSVDAVVTDPPYGYGSELGGVRDIRDIYEAFFEKALRWLKSGGYLVFCCLDKVKTGRKADLIYTEEVMLLLEQCAQRLHVRFLDTHIYPVDKRYRSVYYWKSKYALNRAVVVVRIAKEDLFRSSELGDDNDSTES